MTIDHKKEPLCDVCQLRAKAGIYWCLDCEASFDRCIPGELRKAGALTKWAARRARRFQVYSLNQKKLREAREAYRNFMMRVPSP